MSDMINRNDALEIIQSMYPGIPRVPWLRKDWQKRYEPYIRAEKAIRGLPSAQPEPCGDAVSRQYILDALDEYIEEYGEVDKEGNHDLKWCAMGEAKMVVKEAPSVQTEIIHCQDCIHAIEDALCGGYWCKGKAVTSDHYCGYAKRRTDNANDIT